MYSIMLIICFHAMLFLQKSFNSFLFDEYAGKELQPSVNLIIFVKLYKLSRSCFLIKFICLYSSNMSIQLHLCQKRIRYKYAS